ncbi:Protein RETICULATA-RELATED 4, chloroplastic [Porphyridium purpureum]|uniref:Protein RETICULATA-RELATED 4, chloroplastic n=1 Tax=Porphyridium purpureum TaxID=35688 RepID=A0A5J4YY16_PORPP|nr:Protein RETICULATA-RELATED 4, chloroplastic [Porphyridium purpureum]|eukprot:POR2700..scf208_2
MGGMERRGGHEAAMPAFGLNVGSGASAIRVTQARRDVNTRARLAYRTVSRRARAKILRQAATSVGGGDVPGGGCGCGGDHGGGGGEGGDDKENEFNLNKFFRESGKGWDDVSPDVKHAYEQGQLPSVVVRNDLWLQMNPASKFFVRLGGDAMRARFLADGLFLNKIIIEQAIGLVGKLVAESKGRGEAFWNELDFVGANVVMALLADFGLTYFPAPAVQLSSSKQASAGFIQKALEYGKTLPSSVFQTELPYTMGQRVSTYAFKSVQLFVVGVCCAAIGTALSQFVTLVNSKVSKRNHPAAPVTAAAGKAGAKIAYTAAMYGLFLGLSSNTRYQLVSGIEMHVFPRLFHSAHPLVETAGSFALRFGNTVIGSLNWVWWGKITGAQKKSAH